jgi:hypothetical protein
MPEEVAEERRLQAEANRLEDMERQTATPAGQSTMLGAAAMGQSTEIPPEKTIRTGDAEDAYTLGARMGAQAMAGTAGPAAEMQTGRMTKERIIEAQKLLMKYKSGKASVDRRIINAQDWWKIRNWDQIENKRGTRGATERKSATAWLWNCIVGKHADAMDSFPEPVILPRMQEDKAEAKMLSDIVPVVLEMNGFEDAYNQAQWQKLQEGTGAYYIGWDKMKLGGIGDIAIRNVNLLNLYWEPGCEDIQESENLFFVNIVDSKRLEQMYPQLKGKVSTAYLRPAEYRKDDTVSMDGKSAVVDWYYHTWYGPRKVLHYCQFVGEEVIYSTEDSGMAEGLYADGNYPFVLDPLYPVHGSPAGYGYIDIAEDAQADIDTLNQAMVQNAVVTSTPRYFIQSDGGINEDEFADWSKPFVHTSGGLGENSLRAVETSGIQANAMNMLQQKIDELKFVTGNNDVQNGGTPSGVTAASAIAALQEQSGRASKDSTRAAYRAYNKIVNMVIERIRQFYDIPRQFRILGQNGQEMFVEYSNAKLQAQQLESGLGLAAGFRKPEFDIDVRSQRENAYTKLTQNELAVQFLQMGVFNPAMTDQSLMMLDMMDFKGKEEIESKVRDMGTIQDALMKVGQIAMQLAQKYDPNIAMQLAPVLQGIGMDAGGAPAGGGAAPAALPSEMGVEGAPSNENTLVRRSRERAANASRPE